MTALTPAQKERQRAARSRAGHIRYGMGVIDETMEHVARARAEGDHLTLGYETWLDYVNGEFGPDRLRLPVEKRNRYIELLALAGASQREIAGTVGVSQPTVQRALTRGDSDESPSEAPDGDSPARSPLVEAMTGAIEGAAARIETAGSGPGRRDPAQTDVAASEPDGEQATSPSGSAAAGADIPPAAAPEDHPGASSSPGEAEPVRGVATEPGSAEHGGSATSPAGPSCEKCGGDIGLAWAADGYTRCDECDPDGEHVTDENGRCRMCGALDDVPEAYLPLEIAEGQHGLFLKCGHCASLVSHLKAGMPLALALVEANLHADSCHGRPA